MPTKKKSNKKADDWESELGETSEQVAAPETKDAPAEADAEEEFPAGGLMAMMRKKQKKNKKGKPTDDFVEGEDPPAEDQDQPDLTEKAPVEASIEDEFALPDKKGKGKNVPAKPIKEEDDDEERGADGKVLTKAQKEKLKKDREKQRKKENASPHAPKNKMKLTAVLTLKIYRLRRKRQ
jgi:translation initiation factor 5B